MSEDGNIDKRNATVKLFHATSYAAGVAEVRIWDVSPGYLNRESLLGEHRELHAVYSILVNGKKGYSRHPETLRWHGALSGLIRRHALLIAEMRLRGYSHLSPVDESRGRVRWPKVFVTPPSDQYSLLQSKYRRRPIGRIALPRSNAELWVHHKHSVMARDPDECRVIGRRVARTRAQSDMSSLALDLTIILRRDPPRRPLVNALERMWREVSGAASQEEARFALQSPARMLAVICQLVLRMRKPCLLSSTALSDLAVFLPH